MHIYISICVTLLTLIAAVHLLLKVNSAGGGSILKWLSYFIISVGVLILVCQLTRGVTDMIHHGGGDCKEKCHHGMKGCEGMKGGMHGCMMMGDEGGMRIECKKIMMKDCDMEKENGKCECDSSHAKKECCKGMKEEKEVEIIEKK